MNKLTSIFLSSVIILGTLGTGFADDPVGGKALLEEDKQQIEVLEAKKKELDKAGGNASVIQAYIDLAKEMMELNNERHALHEASKAFADAVAIFSKKIEANIQKVNEILKAQADVAINNSKVVALLKPQSGNNSSDEDSDTKSEKDDDN